MTLKYRKNIYCEWQFIEEYLSRQLSSVVVNSEEKLKSLLAIASVRRIILSPDVVLYVDLDEDCFKEKIKEFDKKMLKAAKRGESLVLNESEKILREISMMQQGKGLQIRCLGNEFVHLADFDAPDNEHLDSIYFSYAHSDLCHQVMENWGILAISPENIESFINYSYDNGVAIQKNEVGGWMQILKDKLPVCNSMVLIDNYVLNDIHQMEENLRPMFDAILPEKLHDGFAFHLAILTGLKKDKRMDLPCMERLEKIRLMMKSIRPSLDVKFTILKCPTDVFHDRTILTNNVWISSGGGFDLYKNNKASKSTIVSVVCPFLNNSVLWSHDAFSNLILEIRNQWQHKNEFTSDAFPSFYIGDGVNRLME